MFELTKGTDLVLGLQSLPVADSIVTDELTQLMRRARRREAKKVNVCLITLSNVLNNADILNIFGGGFGL